MNDAVNPMPDLAPLRKWIHDLNNRVGVVLNSAELLALEPLPPKAEARRKTIEASALEAREVLQAIAMHYL